jgi:hypothetical protein
LAIGQDEESNDANFPGYACPMSRVLCKKLIADLIHEPRDQQLKKSEDILRTSLHPIKLRDDLSVVSISAELDEVSNDILPRDIPGAVGKLAVTIFGDGNCLPRCGSMFAYGCEVQHLEIRLRIAVEMIQHRDLYLNSDYLARGHPLPNSDMLPQRFAQYSEVYRGEVLTSAAVERIYNKEIQLILKAGGFMGIWQLFAMASVLKAPIFVVYPELGNQSVRDDLHRMILPRDMNSRSPRFIMWTNHRDDMVSKHWVPNHFVILLPLLFSCEDDIDIDK